MGLAAPSYHLQICIGFIVRGTFSKQASRMSGSVGSSLRFRFDIALTGTPISCFTKKMGAPFLHVPLANVRRCTSPTAGKASLMQWYQGNRETADRRRYL